MHDIRLCATADTDNRKQNKAGELFEEIMAKIL